MTLIETDVAVIRNTCDTFNVKPPKAVTEAEELLAAARAHHKAVTSTTEFDMSSLTSKNVVATFDAMLIARNQDARVEVANAILDAARGRVCNAWEQAAPEIRPGLGKAFNTAAKAFAVHLAELGGFADIDRAARANKVDEFRAIETAAQSMESLAVVWVLIPVRVETRTTALNAQNALVEFPDYATLIQHFRRVTSGLNAWTPKWIAAVTGLEGVSVRWPDGNPQTFDDLTQAAK